MFVRGDKKEGDRKPAALLWSRNCAV